MEITSKIYLRVPSKWFAMVSKKVFCGARRPFITGILYSIRRRLQTRRQQIPVVRHHSPKSTWKRTTVPPFGLACNSSTMLWWKLSLFYVVERKPPTCIIARRCCSSLKKASLNIESGDFRFQLRIPPLSVSQPSSLSFSSVSRTPLTMVPAISEVPPSLCLSYKSLNHPPFHTHWIC